MTFDPAHSPKLADAKELTTVGMTVDGRGTLFLLVWATWGQAGKGGQYIVSFNTKGEDQSQLEIDGRQILVDQFEVFGSGQFLLRGRRTDTPEPRIAILSSDGATVQDVVGWAGFPSELMNDPSSTETRPQFDYMVRGDDGRVYVAEQDAQQDRVIVYAFRSSGASEAVVKLRPMPRSRQLLGFRSAGDKFAAMYLETGPQSEGSSSEQRGSWWIAVYDHVADGDLRSVYGPVATQPLCYQRTGSEDRFTFLGEGQRLVTMMP